MNLREEFVSTEKIYDGKIIKVRRDTVRLPDGGTGTREIVEHPGGVGVVALDKDNYVYMVRQYRIPFDDLVLEIPAGKLDHQGEDTLACCKRELKEETGFTAERFDYLGKFMLSPGYCAEWLHIYLARDLSAGEAELDVDEFLEVEKYPLSELLEMVMDNRLTDAKTVIGILKTNELLRQGK